MTDNRTTELLPCPFCGGEAETWDGAGPWHVVCAKCGTVGSPCLTEAEAIDAWNARAERTCRNEHGHCNICGAIMYDAPNFCPTCGGRVKALSK